MANTHGVKNTLNSADNGVGNAVNSADDAIDNASYGTITAEDITNDL